MTRWIGFVLGAVLALAVVHRTGVCDFAPLGNTIVAAGRAMIARIPPVPTDADSADDNGPGDQPGSTDNPSPPAVARVPPPDAGSKAPAAGDPAGGPAEPPHPDAGRTAGSPDGEAPPEGPRDGPGAEKSAEDTPAVFAGRPSVSSTETPASRTGVGPADGRPPAASLWPPFRSRRSAEGFAGHLHERFGADLEVRQAGPGVYGVFLTAATEDQLDRELARLRTAGALPLLEDRR